MSDVNSEIPVRGVECMSGAVIAALRLRTKNWIEIVQTALTPQGYSVEQYRGGLDVWHAENRLGDGYFADGWRVGRLWLGPGQNTICVCPHRYYFFADRSVDRRSERDIVNHSQRPKTPLVERLRALKQTLNDLQEGCGAEFNGLVHLNMPGTDLLDGVTLHGARQAFPMDTKPYYVYKQGGFLDSPDRLKVLLCCDDGVSTDHTDDYCRRAWNKFTECGIEAKFQRVTLEKLENRLNEIEQGDAIKCRNVPTLFMLANYQEPPSDRLRQIMRRFDQHDLPWRRAHATDPRESSVANQLGSLLQACGGHPYSVMLAGGECLPWSIGIDLSKRRDFSRVAATLIGGDGRLIGAWTQDQRMGEDIEPTIIRTLLAAAMQRVPVNEQTSGVLVLRDGRVPESEDVEAYRRGFDGPVTLVELRKRRNPPLLLGKERLLPNHPTVAWLPEAVGGSLGFLVTLPQSAKNEFDEVMKIWMRDEWDGMGLGPERLASILAAQTLTPGLGPNQRRLPAPIYWADGIAGASDDDLKFRGQPVTALD